MNDQSPIAIVDYGLGNLFSIKRACEVVGIQAQITSEKKDVLSAPAVILPGVGAFADAMQSLKSLDLIEPLRDVIAADKIVFGICLGLQLLMSVSHEFGSHEGLGIIPGTVERLPNTREGRNIKVPQVGWNRIESHLQSWDGTFLEGLQSGEYQYFVHSYCVVPNDERFALSMTDYEGTRFCSSISRGNLFACQFHPERSGAKGLRIYQNFARKLAAKGENS